MKIGGTEVPGATATIRSNLQASVSADGLSAAITCNPVLDAVNLPDGWTDPKPPGTEPQPTPQPQPGEEVLFYDDFRTLTSLDGFNTRQVTGSGRIQLLDRALDCKAAQGEKAEIGHDLDPAKWVKVGNIYRAEAEFILMQGGPSEIFLCDVETTRAVPNASTSEPGPRLRNKDGRWGIEQDKFRSGGNLSPTSSPPMKKGVPYRFRWESLYHLSAGWHTLHASEDGGPFVLAIDSRGSLGRTGPDTALSRCRWGLTINAGVGAAHVRWFNMRMTVVRG